MMTVQVYVDLEEIATIVAMHVEYHVHGKYRSGTNYAPPEYPELEIGDVRIAGIDEVYGVIVPTDGEIRETLDDWLSVHESDLAALVEEVTRHG